MDRHGTKQKKGGGATARLCSSATLEQFGAFFGFCMGVGVLRDEKERVTVEGEKKPGLEEGATCLGISLCVLSPRVQYVDLPAVGGRRDIRVVFGAVELSRTSRGRREGRRWRCGGRRSDDRRADRRARVLQQTLERCE